MRRELVLGLSLTETVDGRTEMTFHVDGVAGRPGDEGLYDGWTEAFDVLGELSTELLRGGCT